MNQTAKPSGADRPVADLLRDLSTELKALLTDELELVRIEMGRKGKEAGRSAGIFGAATLFGLGAFGALTATLVASLAIVLPLWLASLIVTIAYGTVAAIAAFVASKNLRRIGSAVPDSSAENVRRDVGAIKAGFERGR